MCIDDVHRLDYALPRFRTNSRDSGIVNICKEKGHTSSGGGVYKSGGKLKVFDTCTLCGTNYPREPTPDEIRRWERRVAGLDILA